MRGGLRVIKKTNKNKCPYCKNIIRIKNYNYIYKRILCSYCYKKFIHCNYKKSPSETRGTLEYFTTRSWAGIMKRTINGKYPDWKNRCHTRYLEKGIMVLMTRKEFYKWCNKKEKIIIDLYEKGLTPSIDRINPDDHYSFDNIQIISWEENFKKRRFKKKAVKYICSITNEEKTFESAAEASRLLGIGFRDISSFAHGYRKAKDGKIWQFV